MLLSFLLPVATLPLFRSHTQVCRFHSSISIHFKCIWTNTIEYFKKHSAWSSSTQWMQRFPLRMETAPFCSSLPKTGCSSVNFCCEYWIFTVKLISFGSKLYIVGCTHHSINTPHGHIYPPFFTSVSSKWSATWLNWIKFSFWHTVDTSTNRCSTWNAILFLVRLYHCGILATPTLMSQWSVYAYRFTKS